MWLRSAFPLVVLQRASNYGGEVSLPLPGPRKWGAIMVVKSACHSGELFWPQQLLDYPKRSAPVGVHANRNRAGGETQSQQGRMQNF